MSIRSTVGSVLSRNRSSNLEAEREAIVQRLFITLHKACHKNDEPPKEKHVRTAICQTHEAQSAVLFWKLAAKLPLAVNAVTCWKFAYLVHKLLRDGHQSMIKDSRAYISRLEELAKYWSHIQGYGPLINGYFKLVIHKIRFQNKYAFLPGTINPPDDIEEKLGRDLDPMFEFVLEILDYLEALMLVQGEIFKTMDRSRSSMATLSGQNRLSPCIPIILDSQQLYSLAVKYLSILHTQVFTEKMLFYFCHFLTRPKIEIFAIRVWQEVYNNGTHRPV